MRIPATAFSAGKAPKFGLSIRTTPFTDVAPSDWAYDPIEFVRKEGIFVGYPDGSFQPGNPLTRREAAAMAAKLLRGLRDGTISLGSGQPLRDEVRRLQAQIATLEASARQNSAPPANNPFTLPLTLPPIPPPASISSKYQG